MRLICLGLLRRCRAERSRIADEEEQIRSNSVKEKRAGKISDFLDSDSEMENFDTSLTRKDNNGGFQQTESAASKSPSLANTMMCVQPIVLCFGWNKI